MKFCYTTYAIGKDSSFDECIQLAHAGGCAGIEFRINDLNSDIRDGHMAATMCHLCNMAYRVDRQIHFDPETETVIGDPEANKLVRREYRVPFVIPEQV